MSEISRLTALTIINNENLIFDAAGPNEEGKFSAWISNPDGKPLLNTTPIFNSKDCAISHLRELKENLKKALKEDD